MTSTKRLLRRVVAWLVQALRGNRRLRTAWDELHNLFYFADLHMHDEMLADRPRVDAYHAALQRYVKPGDEVVDMGTGTGVLSCLAAKAGAGRVHAVEFGPIIEAARRVAQENGIDSIEFHHCNSRAFSLPHKVDTIVHEQMGAVLFGENVLANVVDLRDRLLKPGGRILPHLLDMVIVPVQAGPTYAPFAWEEPIHGVSFRALEPFAQADPANYFCRVYKPFPLERFLADPASVVHVDLETATADCLPTRMRYQAPVTQEGTLHGFCVYFTARFDDQIVITSSPADPDRGVSWGVPFIRTEQRHLEPGEIITLDLEAEDLAATTTWRWEVSVSADVSRTAAPVAG